MKSANKVLLINFAVAILLTIVALFSFGPGPGSARDVAVGFGVVCLGLGLIDLIIGVIMLLVDRKSVRNGWLLSGAVLLLLSGIPCGGGASFG